LLTVTPLPLTFTVAFAAKFVPVNVTGTFEPCAPLVGLIEVSVGAAVIVNVTPFVVTPDDVTVTVSPPSVAFAAIPRVAVICVALTTCTLLTVTPLPLRFTVAFAAKFVPVKVTGTFAPCTPLIGVIEVSVGVPVTVKVAPFVVIPDDVTVTVSAPTVAFAAIPKVAVICVALTTCTLLTVTPLPLTFTVAFAAKFVPVKVTGTFVPWTPLVGLIEVSVGPLVMAKGEDAVVPPGVVTVAFACPGDAVAAMLSVAVTWVALTTVMLFTVILGPALITTSLAKFVPVIVTGARLPITPVLGVIELIVGAAGVPSTISMANTPAPFITGTN